MNNEHSQTENPDSWSEQCDGCYRKFKHPNGLPNHAPTCEELRLKRKHAREKARPAYLAKRAKVKKGLSLLKEWFGDSGSDLNFDRGLRSAEPGPSGAPSSNQLDESSEAQNIEVTSTVSEPGRPVASPAAEAPPPQTGRGFRLKKPSVRIRADFLPTSHLPLGLSDIPKAISEATAAGSAGVTSQGSTKPSLTAPSLIPPPPADATSINQLQQRNPALPLKETRKNAFGVYKRYQTQEDIPHDPDAYASLKDLQEEPAEELLNALEEDNALDVPLTSPPSHNFYPYPNLSSFLLGEYFWSDGNEKSQESFNRLLSVLTHPDFRSDDLLDTDWARINRILASSEYEEKKGSESPWADDGISWKTASVTISVPFNSRCNPPGPRPYTIHDFRYRPLIPLIKEKIKASTNRESFHYIPHELRWKPGTAKEDVRLYSELYNSDAFLQAYDDVQSIPIADCDLPRCVVGLMFASDSTTLASFGNANLWPLYLFFANDSKYQRGRPSMKLGEQVAYFEKLPDKFKDFYSEFNGSKNVNPAVLTHCHRELFHAQWKVLLDDEFMHAYEHGIIIECIDGVKRRFFPRIFTYSADYPEK
ncbi:hypothetical protein EST38_g2533 [Candolleomyces aberdarensis]|uniref:Uncharacterized protein n=1 Tax=Candolleomyces aberdarensis TaxID=2316362 RepID=A0A4Q2DUD7_9AGAR|nr:hypothetical protein EST38_g2533 [Candolleomyces aberdarensis]